MNTNTIRRQQLVSRLKRDKHYRDLFVENEIAVGIPFQIRAIREKQNWTQKELARRTGKCQSVISQLENPDYGKLTLSTLKSLASAFDVALMVRFVPFSEIITRAANLSEEDVAVPSFSEDRGLLPSRTAYPISSIGDSSDFVPKSLFEPAQEYVIPFLLIGKKKKEVTDVGYQQTQTTTRDHLHGQTEHNPIYLQ